jgi:Tol biopolymer transport system component/DNA-binding XRE family transcriptional regulator
MSDMAANGNTGSGSAVSFGQWLKQRRKEYGYTQEELAQRAGCSMVMIQRVEEGVRRPSRQLAELIVEALEISPQERSAIVQWARTQAQPVTSTSGALPGGLHGEDAGEGDVTPMLVANPYKGLSAFYEADAPDFFGRGSLTARLVARLCEPVETAHFLAVVGPSGSGKSSVVRAGLVPAIRRLGLPGGSRPVVPVVVDMVPGTHPMEELAAGLLRVAVNPPPKLLEQIQAGPSGLLMVAKRVLPAPGDTGARAGLLLFIDQFEELFTLVHDDAARLALLDNLYMAAMEPHSPVWIVVTLRADFYDRPLVYGNWCELLGQRTELVGPMSVDELHQAIVGPAERVGAVLEPRLVAAIQRDVGDQPGTLPLMEYALTELFEQREGHVLTLAAYRASGGAQGALGRRAEEIYMGLSPAGQEEARRLFQRLVTLGEGVEDTRRRASRSELASASLDEEALDHVLEAFGRYRLLTFDRDLVTNGPTVEMAHEALLKSWARLRDWLDNSRTELRTQRQLMMAATEWASGGRDPSFLAGGVRLAQFEALAEGADRPGGVALTAEEKEYMTASVKERERAQLVQERLRRRITTGLAVGLVLMLILAALAVIQSIQANEQRNVALSQANARATAQAEAETRGAEAFSRELAAKSQAELSSNPNLALLLAIEAGKLSDNAEAQQALQQALIQTQPHTELRYPGRVNLTDAAFSPDGKEVATTSDISTIRVWEVNDSTGTSGNVLTELLLRSRSADLNDQRIVFSPDAGRVLVVDSDGEARLWDLSTQKVTVEFKSKSEAIVNSANFSPDGKYVVTASSDRLATISDASTGKVVVQLVGHDGFVHYAAFSPDGASVVTASLDGTARLWDAHTGRELHEFSGHTAGVNSAVFSPDGKYIVTASDDKTAQLWDVSSGQSIRIFMGHTDTVETAAFSPDGKYIVTASVDGSARVWDTSTGQTLALILASTITPATPTGVTIVRATFSPDGERILLVTSGVDNAARIYPWDLFTPYQQLLLLAPKLAPRQLTCEERQTYLHEATPCGTPTP